jgi:archaellum component FlaC
VLQQEKQESEVATQKLNKKLDDERERYALLSSQFNELNAKMVEIINNVTNLKIDEIEQVTTSLP